MAADVRFQRLVGPRRRGDQRAGRDRDRAWDIAGKRASRPCYQLLSDANRPDVPVYASLGAAPASVELLAPLVQQLLAEQFRGLKLGLQFGDEAGLEFSSPTGPELLSRLRATLETIRAVAGDDFVIGVDGHMGGIPDPISRAEALDVAQVLGEYGVSFFEEPLSYLDPDGYAWLRERSPVRFPAVKVWPWTPDSGSSSSAMPSTFCSPT